MSLSFMLFYFQLLFVGVCMCLKPLLCQLDECSRVVSDRECLSVFCPPGDGEHQSFRQESRSETGVVTGLYGYIENDGSLRVVQYEADENGYRSSTAKYR